MKRVCLLFILAIVAFACSEPSSENGSRTNTAKLKDTISSDTVTSYIADSLVPEDNTYIPITEVNDSTHISAILSSYVLMPYQYHGEEITRSMVRATWYSLSRDSSVYKLYRSVNRFAKVYDPIVDDDSTQSSGWLVSSLKEDDILLANINGLKEGEVFHVPLTKRALAPGEQIYFEYNGAKYKLFASGFKIKATEKQASYIKNYKLHLEHIISEDSPTSEVLYAIPRCDMDHGEANILFVGDLNSDGKVDVILNELAFNSSTLMLYLSSKDNSELKLVALHEAVGC